MHPHQYVHPSFMLVGHLVRKQYTRARGLTKIHGVEVLHKFENFQCTASYWERGALNKLISLSDAERAAGVAAMSAGNHAPGVAHHATRLGIKSIIVMPAITQFTNVRNTRELGGELILHGDTLAASHPFLEDELIGQRGLPHVLPSDHPYVIAPHAQ